jgi:hypothetical protein
VDCDQHGADCGIDPVTLKGILQKTLEQETELLRTYTITSERLHHNEQLKERLQNFAEGNAKRSRQLTDELNQIIE